jgi:hypothetical protein
MAVWIALIAQSKALLSLLSLSLCISLSLSPYLDCTPLLPLSSSCPLHLFFPLCLLYLINCSPSPPRLLLCLPPPPRYAKPLPIPILLYIPLPSPDPNLPTTFVSGAAKIPTPVLICTFTHLPPILNFKSVSHINLLYQPPRSKRCSHSATLAIFPTFTPKTSSSHFHQIYYFCLIHYPDII